MLRRALLLAHRWTGIGLAVFLLPVALSGSVLVWRTELDALLNPDLFRVADASGGLLTEAALAAAIRSRHPPAQVAWVELPSTPGRSARAQVRNWPDSRAPGRVLNEVFLHPATAELLGVRSTTTPRLDRHEFVPWLRRFHYTLHLRRTGMLLVGGVAVAWLLDTLFGTLLTLPRRARAWRKWSLAWRVRGARAGFDLHRAGGLWLWPLLVMLAASGVYLNLAHEVFVPVVEWLLAPLPARWRDPTVTTLLELQYPLHTGEAFGLAGRLVVSVGGLAVVALAATGLMLGGRRLARFRARHQGAGPASRAAAPEAGARSARARLASPTRRQPPRDSRR